MVIWCTKACQRAKSHELLNVCCSDLNDCSDGMDIKAGRLQAGDLLDMRKMYDTSRESTVNGVSLSDLVKHHDVASIAYFILVL